MSKLRLSFALLGYAFSSYITDNIEYLFIRLKLLGVDFFTALGFTGLSESVLAGANAQLQRRTGRIERNHQRAGEIIEQLFPSRQG